MAAAGCVACRAAALSALAKFVKSRSMADWLLWSLPCRAFKVCSAFRAAKQAASGVGGPTIGALGRPIGQNQGVAFQLADMAASVDAARLLTWRAAWMGHRDAKIFTIFEGTSEIQRMIIGRAVTGLDVR